MFMIPPVETQVWPRFCYSSFSILNLLAYVRPGYGNNKLSCCWMTFMISVQVDFTINLDSGFIYYVRFRIVRVDVCATAWAISRINNKTSSLNAYGLIHKQFYKCFIILLWKNIIYSSFYKKCLYFIFIKFQFPFYILYYWLLVSSHYMLI